LYQDFFRPNFVPIFILGCVAGGMILIGGYYLFLSFTQSFGEELQLLASFALLGGGYALTKIIKFYNSVFIIDSHGFKFRDRRYTPQDVEKITRHWIARRNPNRSMSLLGQSWLYKIHTRFGVIEVLGKLYKDDERLIKLISKSTKTSIEKI